MYFSPSRLAFINVATPAWTDLVPVTQEVYQDAIAKKKAKTHELTAGPDNQPLMVEIPPVPVVEPTADEVFAGRLASLNYDYETSISAVHSTYPLTETISWNDQVREARAYLKSIEDGTECEDMLFIQSLFDSRAAGGIEETLPALAARILELHSLITPIIADITGKRHVAERALQAAKEDPDAVKKLNQVVWDLTA